MCLPFCVDMVMSRNRCIPGLLFFCSLCRETLPAAGAVTFVDASGNKRAVLLNTLTMCHCGENGDILTSSL